MVLATGCRSASSSTSSANRLSIPPRDHVRLLVREVPDPAAEKHWKWSVIGERNWTVAEVDTQNPEQVVVRLKETFPINRTDKKSGCNIWECDLTVKEGQINYRIHGIDGTTATADAPVSGEKPEILRVAQTKDATVRLPAEVTLAEVVGKKVVFQIAK
ncbi:MAG: hypothetical protein OHK0029_32340 [Armatimonadaceae bacterium]